MTHIADFIDAILDRDPDPDALDLARRHLLVCPACAAEWEPVLRIHQLLLADTRLARIAALAAGAAPTRLARPGLAIRALQAAVLLLALAGAFTVGRTSAPEPASPSQTTSAPAPLAGDRLFMLLLVGSDAAGMTATELQRLGVEFREWTRRNEDDGRIAGRGVLGGETSIVRGPVSRPLPEPDIPLALLHGYYVIRAADESEAIRLARTIPYLEYRGSVIVREVASAAAR
jgi:hypothetical protein